MEQIYTSFSTIAYVLTISSASRNGTQMKRDLVICLQLKL